MIHVNPFFILDAVSLLFWFPFVTCNIFKLVNFSCIDINTNVLNFLVLIFDVCICVFSIMVVRARNFVRFHGCFFIHLIHSFVILYHALFISHFALKLRYFVCHLIYSLNLILLLTLRLFLHAINSIFYIKWMSVKWLLVVSWVYYALLTKMTPKSFFELNTPMAVNWTLKSSFENA